MGKVGGGGHILKSLQKSLHKTVPILIEMVTGENQP